MSKRHKWYNEIVAWASGAEIESYAGLGDEIWDDEPYPDWNHTVLKFRIKPTPKEPQYLYLYVFADLADWEATRISVFNCKKDYETYIGKIKLEGDENE